MKTFYSSKQHRFLRKPDVLKRFGISNSQLYKLIQLGKFPAPIKLSTRSSAWIESELDEHANNLVAASRGKINTCQS